MSAFYLEVDSTYRDRNEYPLPADFVVPIAQSGSGTPATALDPVSNAAPYSLVFTPFSPLSGSVQPYTAPLGASGTVIQVPVAQNASKLPNYYAGLVINLNDGFNNNYRRVLTSTYLQTVGGFDYIDITFFLDYSISVPNIGGATFQLDDPTSLGDPLRIVMFIPFAPFVGNFYAGDFLFNQTRNEWITIQSYELISHIVIASPEDGDNYTPGTWLLTDQYFVRHEIPVQYGNVLAGITHTTMTIVDTLRNYIGSYIRLVSTNEMRRIVAFDPATSIATVNPGFDAIPAGAYEILQFSYDNAGRVAFNFSEVSTSNATCYGVTLLNLIVPNIRLKYAYGGHAIYYPYLYVVLSNVSSAESKGPNMIASNNIYSTRMVFRVLVNDSNPALVSPVVRLDADEMTQNMTVRPLDNFHFSVYRPDGALLITDSVDTTSPVFPDPASQISALFKFVRL